MSTQPDETSTLEGAISVAPASRRVPTGIVRVNLVPAEIAEARQVKITGAAMIGVAVLTLGIVGFLYHQQSSAVSSAKTDLAAAQSVNAQLTTEQSRLGNVDALYAKVDAAQAMLTAAESPQVLWSRYLEDLRLQLPEHSWLTSISATETAASPTTPTTTTPAGSTATSGAAAPAATATTPAATIGTLDFSGSAYTHNDVADLLDRLAGLHGLTNPYLASSTEALTGTGSSAVATVTWSATAGLTSDALKSSYTSANGAVTP